MKRKRKVNKYDGTNPFLSSVVMNAGTANTKVPYAAFSEYVYNNPNGNPTPTPTPMQEIAAAHNLEVTDGGTNFKPKEDITRPDPPSGDSKGNSVGAARIAAAAAGTAALGFNNITNGLKGADTSEYEALQQNQSLRSNADTYDALMAEQASRGMLNTNITAKMLGSTSTKDMIMNSFKDAAGGAATGMAAGPWGVLAGAVTDQATSLIGSMLGNAKISKQAAQVSRDNAYANYTGQLGVANQSYNIGAKNAALAKANFSAFGGDVATNGADFPTGLRQFNSGGSHEQNPYEGVQIGVDPQGTPNLVEEGETMFDNYVFSNRLQVPKDVKKVYKIGGKKLSFADASKKLGKEAEEMPNDPIARRTQKAMLNRLKGEQESVKEAQRQEEMATQMAQLQAAGITPEMLQQAQAEQQMPQQGMAPEEAMMAQQLMGGAPGGYAYGGNLFAMGDAMNLFARKEEQYGKRVDKQNEAAANTPIDFSTYVPTYDTKTNQYDFETNRDVYNFIMGGANDGNRNNWNRIYQAYKTLPGYSQVGMGEALMNAKSHWYDEDALTGGYDFPTSDMSNVEVVAKRPEPTPPVETPPAPAPVSNTAPKAPEWNLEESTYPTWMRYAPVFGSALGLALASSKPDYSRANKVEKYALDSANYRGAEFNPIGNYMQYKPLDRNYYLEQLRQQSAAAQDAIINASNGDRSTQAAGILGNAYNTMIAQGSLAKQAEESNREFREKVATFNRETDKYNSESALQQSITNATNYMKAREKGLTGIAAANQMRDELDMNRRAAINANLSGIFTNLGAIGKENFARNQQEMLLNSGYYGVLHSKPSHWSDAKWEQYKQNLKEDREYQLKLKDQTSSERKALQDKVKELERAKDEMQHKMVAGSESQMMWNNMLISYLNEAGYDVDTVNKTIKRKQQSAAPQTPTTPRKSKSTTRRGRK